MAMSVSAFPAKDVQLLANRPSLRDLLQPKSATSASGSANTNNNNNNNNTMAMAPPLSVYTPPPPPPPPPLSRHNTASYPRGGEPLSLSLPGTPAAAVYPTTSSAGWTVVHHGTLGPPSEPFHIPTSSPGGSAGRRSHSSGPRRAPLPFGNASAGMGGPRDRDNANARPLPLPRLHLERLGALDAVRQCKWEWEWEWRSAEEEQQRSDSDGEAKTKITVARADAGSEPGSESTDGGRGVWLPNPARRDARARQPPREPFGESESDGHAHPAHRALADAAL
ncbi:hypothetical protein C8F04DRAFT_70828 [Mycena alexandri]|uniref:Uncharacterized protein n=1 Tax=Mycena alexandri TaxID=1745969 RepID=A0AAD6SI31_9AGAR|nr:hypothetical protein C8F04DRAFT_70828 [Mycena alexandri]